MAHYAYISNAEFTTTERARFNEVNKEIDVIRQDNIESEGYQLLYSSLESKETSDTLQTLETELEAINMIQEPEAYDAKEAEINTEKERLAEDRAEIKDQLHELEYNNTEDLIAEKNTLETTIANALCRVTNVIVGHDELEARKGDTSSIDEEIEALEESKKNIDYTQDEEVWMAEVEAIQAQIQTKLEEKNDIPKVDYDNTIYWEGFYGAKRTSYNGNIRKHFASKGMIYDPVRDAFYAEQPYSSWTLNEETCIWESPTPKPEGQHYWKEDTTEWVDYVYYNPDNNQPCPSWVWDTTTGVWNAPVEKPEGLYIWDEETTTWESTAPYSSWIWDSENKKWKAPVDYPNDGNIYLWDEETQNWIENGNN